MLGTSARKAGVQLKLECRNTAFESTYKSFSTRKLSRDEPQKFQGLWLSACFVG
jgi:hypothetical protein